MASATKYLSLFIKLLFLVCIPMQTMLWPTVSSICFVCVYGLINIMVYMHTTDVTKAVFSSGVYLYPLEKRPVNYAFMVIMFCYFAIYFFQFLAQQAQLLPTNTLWLDPSLAANFTAYTLTNLPAAVTSDASKTMRTHTFEWAKTVQVLCLGPQFRLLV